MQVELHAVAISGMVVPMTTPGLYMTSPKCLIFDYEVEASDDTPILEVHARMTDYMLSGKRIWTSDDYDLHNSKAHVTLFPSNSSRDLSYVLDFVAIVAEPTSTIIRIANIGFSDGQCNHGRMLFSSGGSSGIVGKL